MQDKKQIYGVSYFTKTIALSLCALLIFGLCYFMGRFSNIDYKSASVAIPVLIALSLIYVSFYLVHYSLWIIIDEKHNIYKINFKNFVSDKVDLASLSTVKLRLDLANGDGLTYKLTLTDRANNKLKFGIAFWPGKSIRNQDKLIAIINENAKRNGIVYDEFTESKLGSISIKTS